MHSDDDHIRRSQGTGLKKATSEFAGMSRNNKAEDHVALLQSHAFHTLTAHH